MTNATHSIEISVDACEADQFAAWLNANGHSAAVGKSTASYVDGARTGSDPAANEIMNGLWSAYCDA